MSSLKLISDISGLPSCARYVQTLGTIVLFFISLNSQKLYCFEFKNHTIAHSFRILYYTFQGESWPLGIGYFIAIVVKLSFRRFKL